MPSSYRDPLASTSDLGVRLLLAAEAGAPAEALERIVRAHGADVRAAQVEARTRTVEGQLGEPPLIPGLDRPTYEEDSSSGLAALLGVAFLVILLAAGAVAAFEWTGLL